MDTYDFNSWAVRLAVVSHLFIFKGVMQVIEKLGQLLEMINALSINVT